MNLLVDASNVMWRAHHGSKNFTERQKQGNYTDVHVFLNSVKSYKNMFPVSNVWIVWDKKIDYNIPNPRKEILDSYKDGRSKEGARDVFENGDLVAETLALAGCRNFYPSHLEADDCIAWLTRKFESLDEESVIFSADSDMAQLVTEKVSFYNLNKKRLITLSDFEEEYGCSPEQFVIYKCVLGDTADKIIGVPGYGKKKSLRVAKDWGVKELDSDIKMIVESNLQLVDLRHDNFIDERELDCYNIQFKSQQDVHPQFSEFYNLLKELGLRTHANKIREWENLFESVEDLSLKNALSSLGIL